MKITKIILAVLVITVMLVGILPITAAAMDFSNARNIGTINPLNPFPTMITGNLATADTVNFYRFTLTEPGRVIIDFSHVNLEDSAILWRIDFFDSSQNSIAQRLESRGVDTNVSSQTMFLAAGTYYIRVIRGPFAHNWNTTNYTISVNYTQNTGEFEIESNDPERTGATQMRLNIHITGSIWNSDNVDWYRFELEHPGRVYLTFAHANLETTSILWRLDVFDSTENEVMQRLESRGNETSVRSQNMFLAAGIYYIRVMRGPFANNWNDTEYRLTVNYTQNIGQFEIESNDTTRVAATQMQINAPIIGSIWHGENVDWYRFNVTTSGYFHITFAHANLEVNTILWRMDVFDSMENEVIPRFESRGNQPSVSSEVRHLTTGTYYIRVARGPFAHNWDDTDYTLTVVGQEPPITIPPPTNDMEIVVTGIQYEIRNPGETQLGRAIITVFDSNNVLVYARMNNIAVLNTGANTGIFDGLDILSILTNGYRVRLFVWTDEGNMIPLAAFPAEVNF